MFISVELMPNGCYIKLSTVRTQVCKRTSSNVVGNQRSRQTSEFSGCILHLYNNQLKLHSLMCSYCVIKIIHIYQLDTRRRTQKLNVFQNNCMALHCACCTALVVVL